MIKQFMDFAIITLLCIAGFTHLLRLLYLIFRPRILERITFVARTEPSKTQLALYYLLTIIVCAYAITYKLN